MLNSAAEMILVAQVGEVAVGATLLGVTLQGTVPQPGRRGGRSTSVGAGAVQAGLVGKRVL